MRLTAFLLVISVLFIGCAEKTLEEQKLQCLEQGNKFTIDHVLNYRTGEVEKKGYCM